MPLPTPERVATLGSLQRVTAGIANSLVDAFVSEDAIWPRHTDQKICAVATGKLVASRSPSDSVISSASNDEGPVLVRR